MEAVVTIGCLHGSRGGVQGVQTPSLKDLLNIGFLSNTGPDPLKITKAISQHSMLAHHWHAGRWWAAFSGMWITSPLINFKK